MTLGHRLGRKQLLWASAAMGTALGFWSGAAGADGFSGRPYQMSTDPAGIGTLQSAHAPQQGTMVLGVAGDFVRKALWHKHDWIAHDLLQSRMTLGPMMTFGLPSAFALTIRAPFSVYDLGYKGTGEKLPATGVQSPSVGLLIPLLRWAQTDSRIGARATFVVPVGRSRHYMSENGFAVRAELVLSGQVGPFWALISGGGYIARSRSVENAHRATR